MSISDVAQAGAFSPRLNFSPQANVLSPSLAPTMQMAQWSKAKLQDQIMKRGLCPNEVSEGKFCLQRTHKCRLLGRPLPLTIPGKVDDGRCLVCANVQEEYIDDNTNHDDAATALGLLLFLSALDEEYRLAEEQETEVEDRRIQEILSSATQTTVDCEGLNVPARPGSSYTRPLHLLIEEAANDSLPGTWNDVMLWIVCNPNLAASEVVSFDGGPPPVLPLHIACFTGAPFFVVQALLLLNRSTVAVPDEEGDFPLHNAAYQNRETDAYDVMLLLVQAFPLALFFQDQKGRTPLHWAFESEKGPPPIEVVDLLLGPEARALMYADKDGKTPLDTARSSGAEQIYIDFLEAKAMTTIQVVPPQEEEKVGHCIHCSGEEGDCACSAGCPVKASTACSASYRHCPHCKGMVGPCACPEGCPARTESLCEVLHFGVRCDSCGKEGIVGVRYKCSICYDYDLCEKCYGSGAHDQSHYFAKIERVGSVPVRLELRSSTETAQAESSSADGVFAKGRGVRLAGLSDTEGFNGANAVVLFDCGSNVLVLLPQHEDKKLLVKKENLELLGTQNGGIQEGDVVEFIGMANKEWNGKNGLVIGIDTAGDCNVQLLRDDVSEPASVSIPAQNLKVVEKAA